MNIRLLLHALEEFSNPTSPAIKEFKKKAEKALNENKETMKEIKDKFYFNLELSKMLMTAKISTIK